MRLPAWAVGQMEVIYEKLACPGRVHPKEEFFCSFFPDKKGALYLVSCSLLLVTGMSMPE